MCSSRGGGLWMVCWCFFLISKWPGGTSTIGRPSLWAAGPPLPTMLHTEGRRPAAPLQCPGHQLPAHCSSEATAAGLWEVGPSPGEGSGLRAQDPNTVGSVRTK